MIHSDPAKQGYTNTTSLDCHLKICTGLIHCLAGCTTGGDNFTNCACVLGGQSHSSPDPFSAANPLHGGANTLSKAAADDNDFQEVTMIPVATSGPCYSQCQMIMPFMVLLFFMTLVVAVTQMPVLMVVLRYDCTLFLRTSITAK